MLLCFNYFFNNYYNTYQRMYSLKEIIIISILCLDIVVVSNSSCPPGYTGLHCEECIEGYFRRTNSILDNCVPCNCYGHSNLCDQNTGECQMCQHNTVGENCEKCTDGFYGLATSGTPEDCKACPCPLTIPSNQFSLTCTSDDFDGQSTCDACLPGYTGRNCEKCAYGYWGNPSQPGSKCERTERKLQNLKISPIGLLKRVGEEAKIECTVSSNFPHWFQWFHNNNTVESHDNSITVESSTSESSLLIRSLSLHHSGLYTCRVVSGSRSIQKVALLTVLDINPIIRVQIDEPKTQRVPVGTTVTFRCNGQGRDVTPNLVWTKDGALLPAPATEAHGVLTILNVNAEDSGTYVCTERTNNAQDKATLLVEERTQRPTVPLRIIIQPHYQEVKVGDFVEFRCIVEGFPEPEIRWTGGRNEQMNPEATFDNGLFRIPSARKSDEDEYFCIATNLEGTESMRTILLVRGEDTSIKEEPQVTILPSSVEAQRSETVRFECQVTGSPTPSITWSFNDGDLPTDSSQDGEVLTLPRVTEVHQGIYICTATNYHGTVQAQARLIITPSLPRIPRININPPRQVAKPGDVIDLYCSASGDQPITIEWSKIGGTMAPNVLQSGGIIRFQGITANDAGQYLCSAVNAAGKAEEVAEIIINDETSSDLKRKAITFIGSDVRLKCPFSELTDVQLEWSKEGGHLPDNSRLINNELWIQDARLDNAGRYTCITSFTHGQMKDYVDLTVRGSQVLNVKIEASKGTIAMGDTLDLQCEISGGNAAKISWTKVAEDEPLPENVQIGGNILRINGVRSENGGIYRCSAENDDGIFSDDYVLAIQAFSAVEIKIKASKERINMGDTLDLQCEISGDSSAKISWFKVSEDGPLPENVRIGDNILIINGVQPENGGVYRCNVESDAGIFSDDYVLAIQEPPTISPELVETRTAPFGSTIVFDCETSLDPPIAYTWYKQGGSLPNNHSVSEDQLTLPDVKGDDAGTYICIAKNPVTSIDVPITLLVTGVVPYFEQTPNSYMKMPSLANDYLDFEITIAFKPENKNGLILYNSYNNDKGHFISLILNDGHVEFRFKLGSGVTMLRSQNPIDMDKWHTVQLKRNRIEGILTVDDEPKVTEIAQGKILDIDLSEPMYIGSVPDFNAIPDSVGMKTGFVGCISYYKTGNVIHKLFEEAESVDISICDTCTPAPCQHGGICQGALTLVGYNCICSPGFSGRDCENVGESCYPGVCGEGRCINRPKGGFSCYCPLGRTGLRCEKDIVIIEPAMSDDAYIAYPTPSAARTLKLNMKVKPRTTDDCLISYCGQSDDGTGDFTSLAIKNKSVEFRFNMGSGPAIIRSLDTIQADEWLNIVAERNRREGKLIINDGIPSKGLSPGHARGLTLNTPFYVGSVDKEKVKLPSSVGVQHGFDGCIAHIEVNAVKVDLVNSVIDSSNVDDCSST